MGPDAKKGRCASGVPPFLSFWAFGGLGRPDRVGGGYAAGAVCDPITSDPSPQDFGWRRFPRGPGALPVAPFQASVAGFAVVGALRARVAVQVVPAEASMIAPTARPWRTDSRSPSHQ